MAHAADLKTAQERTVRAMSLRPAIGRGTAVTTVKIASGETLARIADGDWKLQCDVGKDSGGMALAPDPGVFIRAGLGSCLAIGYVLWAARLDVPVDDVQVTVQADYDARGMYGVDESVPPGYGAVRYIVDITSSAPEERVRALIEMADRHSPVLYDVSTALPVAREVRITGASRI